MKNPFSKKITDENFELSMKRYDAFFNGEVYDRPPVSITFPMKPQDGEAANPGEKTYASDRDRWMDVEYRAKQTSWQIDCTEYYSDAMPAYSPNLGPEVFSAICGCDYYFGSTTTWTKPNIIDWERDTDKAVMDRSSEYFIAVEKFTRELLKYSKDKFAVGFTDLHPGADHVAALRDPEILCADLYDYPEFVKAKLKSSYEEYFEFYDYFYDMIRNGGSPSSGWINLLVDGKYHIVGNDFSCMVSPEMFGEFFLEGITEECEKLDRSIYHLDGPGAIKHLDVLLEIKKLNSVQWICGAGNEGFDRWIDLYKTIQKSKKGIMLQDIHVKDLDSIIANLKPDGLWFAYLNGISNREEADWVIKRIKNWK